MVIHGLLVVIINAFLLLLVVLFFFFFLRPNAGTWAASPSGEAGSLEMSLAA